MKTKLVHKFIIGTFVSLYLLVSVISTIHVIDFFRISNPYWLAVSLAVAFELGAAASLASLIILDKMNKGLVWILFIAITLMQMQGNMYYAFANMGDFRGWSELFGLMEDEIIYQKRILAAVSGAILPLVALGFIKSLVDYIKPESEVKSEESEFGTEVIKKNFTPESFGPEPKQEKSTSVQKTNLPVKPKLQISEDSPSVEVLDKPIVDAFQDGVFFDDPVENKTENESVSLEKNKEESLIIKEEIESVRENSMETPEERIEEDLSSTLQDEEVEAILSDLKTSKNTVSGYYGDVSIDGNRVTIQESEILPVNSNKSQVSNKPQGMVDSASKVYLSPTRL